MNNYNLIAKDPYIIDLYDKVSILEDKNKGWNHHDLKHAIVVAKLSKEILKNLGHSKDIIDDALVAALLHDIGCIEGKENHAPRGAEMAEKYIHKKMIQLNNEKAVIEAIKMHSDGFETENIIAQVLMLADKIDIKKTRLAKGGYNVDGVKETQYINDIKINIDNQQLIINFVTDKNIDIDKLKTWYFLPKVFMAINSFSRKNNLEPVILLDNKVWK